MGIVAALNEDMSYRSSRACGHAICRQRLRDHAMPAEKEADFAEIYEAASTSKADADSEEN